MATTSDIINKAENAANFILNPLCSYMWKELHEFKGYRPMLLGHRVWDFTAQNRHRALNTLGKTVRGVHNLRGL
jgi:hypothetical protein